MAVILVVLNVLIVLAVLVVLIILIMVMMNIIVNLVISHIGQGVGKDRRNGQRILNRGICCIIQMILNLNGI